MPKETQKRTYLYIRWAYKRGGGGGAYIRNKYSKNGWAYIRGGLKPGGFNVGFYGSIFFYCFDSAMILNDGRKMVLVWIWDEGEGVAARPGTEFKWLPLLTN